ncbi:LOW QUALITY PROTEIN: forkhead box protein O4 [Mantella aurantiaca]
MEGTEPPPPPVDIDPDFEPQARPRSCTWPLPRPELSVVQPAGVPAEEGRTEAPPLPIEGPGGPGVTPRKGGSRRNAWGNQSYAELISQAIESSPDKRLTLSQIYEWMVRTIPYFKDKGDSNSSAGWKNSIRHNLSLHSKFIKVHNEATGKSSWWMLNPEGGKSGKAPRRRAASMDNSSKLAKVRSKVSKKKAQVPGDPPAASPGSQSSKWPGSPSHGTDEPDVWTSFRSRTGSNASNLSLRLSPILTEQDDPADGDNVPPTVSEELELIDGLTMLSSGAPPAAFAMRPPQPLSFGNSLFSPVDVSPGHFPRPQTLEALLTSDSPPPANVLMGRVDPVLAQSGGQSLLLLGGKIPALGAPAPPNTLPMLGLPAPKPLGAHVERLPTDLDIDMFLENLECDVDYIINSELMDEGGLDFNFEPLHPPPATNPGNNHSWLPS